MRYVVTAAEMRAIDQATIADIGLPGVVLMENAGRAVADVVMSELGGRRGPVAVVCGAGNNGGDGHVCARILRERGVSAFVYLAVPRAAVAGDARIHLDAFEQCGGLALSIASGDELGEQRPHLEAALVVVDALFGTGLTRAVTGHLADVIDVINRGPRIVAVDLPSGLDADRGAALGALVRPHRTVTMALLKVGVAVAPGVARAGQVEVAAIGIPVQLAAAHGVRLAELEATDLAAVLPRLDLLSHKHRRGHVLAVAGSPGKRGAGRLTALAALRAGAGLVTLAGAGEVDAPDPVMTAELDAGSAGAPAALAELARGKAALAIGPGMASGPGGRALVHAALALALPVVLDADGLNHLVGELARVAAAPAVVIMTPHPGEAARLLGCTAAEVERDRVTAVRRLAEAARAVVVLKGARTLVCDGITGDGFVTINPTGNPGLATAGTGDVLAGVLAALVAQGVNPGEAARLAVWLHGAAGDLCARDIGTHGMIASDVIERVPRAIAELARAIA